MAQCACAPSAKRRGARAGTCRRGPLCPTSLYEAFSCGHLFLRLCVPVCYFCAAADLLIWPSSSSAPFVFPFSPHPLICHPPRFVLLPSFLYVPFHILQWVRTSVGFRFGFFPVLGALQPRLADVVCFPFRLHLFSRFGSLFPDRFWLFLVLFRSRRLVPLPFSPTQSSKGVPVLYLPPSLSFFYFPHLSSPPFSLSLSTEHGHERFKARATRTSLCLWGCLLLWRSGGGENVAFGPSSLGPLPIFRWKPVVFVMRSDGSLVQLPKLLRRRLLS